MTICDNKIKGTITTGIVVDKLSQLRRLLEDDIRFEVIEVTKEVKLDVAILGLQIMETFCNVIICQCFGFAVWLGIESTYHKHFEGTFEPWDEFYPD